MLVRMEHGAYRVVVCALVLAGVLALAVAGFLAINVPILKTRTADAFAVIEKHYVDPARVDRDLESRGSYERWKADILDNDGALRRAFGVSRIVSLVFALAVALVSLGLACFLWLTRPPVQGTAGC